MKNSFFLLVFELPSFLRNSQSSFLLWRVSFGAQQNIYFIYYVFIYLSKLLHIPNWVIFLCHSKLSVQIFNLEDERTG